ncbi:hypothetical protein NGA_0500900, partial [Nannochloropsis gaditana CCMP526]
LNSTAFLSTQEGRTSVQRCLCWLLTFFQLSRQEAPP